MNDETMGVLQAKPVKMSPIDKAYLKERIFATLVASPTRDAEDLEAVLQDCKKIFGWITNK